MDEVIEKITTEEVTETIDSMVIVPHSPIHERTKSRGRNRNSGGRGDSRCLCHLYCKVPFSMQKYSPPSFRTAPHPHSFARSMARKENNHQFLQQLLARNGQGVRRSQSSTLIYIRGT